MIEGETVGVERLAFALHEPEERDFAAILVEPLPVVVQALSTQPDIFALAANLPDAEHITEHITEHVTGHATGHIAGDMP